MIKKFAALALRVEDFTSVLRYVFFTASLVIYGYVFYIHNQERIQKKKERE